MSFHELYFVLRDDGSDGCVTCSNPPPCACTANQQCVTMSRNCTICSQNICRDIPSTSSSSGGVSKGAVAGAVIGILLFLALAIGAFLWYRRNLRINQRIAESQMPKPDVPASALDVLSRPDPIVEKPSYVHQTQTHVTDLESHTTPDRVTPHRSMSGDSVQSNPFTDTHSIQTTSTEGTNAIPIALAPAPSAHQHQDSNLPLRPLRSPDLNLEHVNVSDDSTRNGGTSMISGISGVSSNRQSYMTNASYASDFLEAPMIVTGQSGAVRQMLGLAKAEVVNAPSSPGQQSSVQSSGRQTLTVPMTGRTTLSSPLAMSSFGPGDVISEMAEESNIAYAHHDPFGDEHSPLPSSRYAPGTPQTATTFGGESDRPRDSSTTTASEWAAEGPQLPWAQRDPESRPASMSTQAGSVIDIGSATRVNVGLRGNPNRTTMAKLVSPSTAGFGSMERQQSDHAQTPIRDNRTSISSAISTSTRADSILESFPFVPPSPISNRPIRTPPVSPLTKQVFSTGAVPPSPVSISREDADDRRDSDLVPPNRKFLGMSSASQSSNASSGLGSFPFQISEGNSAPPSAFSQSFNQARQRASLDTLALTADLSSYPLGIDTNDQRM